MQAFFSPFFSAVPAALRIWTRNDPRYVPARGPKRDAPSHGNSMYLQALYPAYSRLPKALSYFPFFSRMYQQKGEISPQEDPMQRSKVVSTLAVVVAIMTTLATAQGVPVSLDPPRSG